MTDEQQIRDLVATWIRATEAGDLETVLGLMTEDVVFLIPGQSPMRGRETFAAGARTTWPKMRIECKSDIQEIQVSGDLAYCWNHLSVTLTPLAGGATLRHSGFTLTVLRRQPAGNWQVVRDANMVLPEK
jgi:uncharacterized protein (TIGR02246 family)